MSRKDRATRSLWLAALLIASPLRAQQPTPPTAIPPPAQETEPLPPAGATQPDALPPPALPPEADMPQPQDANATPPPAVDTSVVEGNKPSGSKPNPEIPSEGKPGADTVPPGQELVNIDFPEPTEIKDIVKAVSMWTGKNVILGRDVAGKVQMLSPRKVTKEEAYQMFLSALNMLNFTTVETGKVIKIMPVRSAVKGNLKTYMGASYTPLTDELITQIVPLKYIDAKELQNTLGRVVTTNAMIAYPPTNTLIISDSGYKIRRILDIIELLDVQGQQPQIAIVPIRYADAKSISEKVTEIFKMSASAKSPSSRGGIANHKLLVDERTNSVIIFGPPRTIQDVRALVKRFDTQIDDPTRQASIHVRPLDYADAKKLAATLSSLSQGSKSAAGGGAIPRRPPMALNANRPPTSGALGLNSAGDGSPTAVADLGDDVKITADESLNALLITGSRAAYDSINSLVRKLDVRRSQVFVEAEILDINVDGNFRFGTSIFAGYGKEQGNKTALTWEAAGIGPLVVSNASDVKSDQNLLGAVDVFKEEMNIGILSGTEVNVPGIGKVNPGALIKMIKTDAATKALASPHLLTANNEVAKILVGDKIFYKTQDPGGTAGVPITKVQHEDVDLSLEIKPSVSYANYVTLKIDLDANQGKYDSQAQLPAVSKRKSSQLVTVKNGQTVVISGLMKTTESEVYKKIPLLGDLPILGWLFRNSSLEKRRNNLMIFLTPHIVHGADDLAAIYQAKIRDRDDFLKKVFGSKGVDDDFYALLPKKEDGEYRPDEVDNLEQQNRERLMQDMRRDMGYGTPQAASPPTAEQGAAPTNSEDDTITVPLGGAGTGGSGSDSGSDAGTMLTPPTPGGGAPVPGGAPGGEAGDDGAAFDEPPPMDEPPAPIDTPSGADE